MPSPGQAPARHHLEFLIEVFRLSAIPFVAALPDGLVLAFNPALCQLTGYDEQEMPGVNVLTDLTPPQWRQTVEKALERLHRSSRPQRYERELLRKDGSTLPVELFVHQVCDEEGRLQYHWTFMLDISERKKAEQALRESEAFSRSMVEAFDGYIYVCGPGNRVEFMNERMIERTGRNAVGELCFEALHERDSLCPWCVNEQVFKGELVRWEVQSPKDGHWWYVVNAPIHHADGSVSKQAMIQDITARKQAEADLKESEAKFRTLTETTASAIFIIQDDRFRYMNPAGQGLCGYGLEELAGMSFWEIVYPEDRELVRTRGAARLAGQMVMPRYEFRILTKQGQVVWADFTGGLIEYQGRPAILGTAFDITERKQSALALKNSQQRQGDIIAFLPDPTFAVDAEGRIIAWNKALEEMTGVKAEQALGQGDYFYSLPFYGERRAVLVDLAMRWDEEIERRYSFVHRDNHTLLAEVFVPHLRPGGVYLWAKATPLCDSQGQIVGAIETVRDITPRKQMERALRESAEKHRALVHSLPVGVVTLDASFRVTELNAQGEVITGLSQEEALGKYCWEVLQGGECTKGCPLQHQSKPLEAAGPMEATIVNRQRGQVPVRLSAARLYDAANNMVGGVEVFQDISEIKALERERANIVSMFAHDMKSPLVSIQGFASRLLSEAAKVAPDKQAKYLDIIRKEAGKLESLINDFLDFARLETGSLKLNFGATDLDKELVDLLEVFQPRFANNDMTLVLRSGEKLPLIQADAPRLRRVFTNILENAMKYSPGGTTVTVESMETEQEVRVSVSDQGMGIAPEELPKIFDVFYRSRSQEKREGHGLGLAGVEAIVKGHGGRVMVTSQLGEGSTFIVALPKSPPSQSQTG